MHHHKHLKRCREFAPGDRIVIQLNEATCVLCRAEVSRFRIWLGDKIFAAHNDRQVIETILEANKQFILEDTRHVDPSPR